MEGWLPEIGRERGVSKPSCRVVKLGFLLGELFLGLGLQGWFLGLLGGLACPLRQSFLGLLLSEFLLAFLLDPDFFRLRFWRVFAVK